MSETMLINFLDPPYNGIAANLQGVCVRTEFVLCLSSLGSVTYAALEVPCVARTRR